MDCTPKSVDTRLLLPFYMTRRATDAAVAEFARQSFRGERLWQPCHAAALPTPYYQDETHRATIVSLFGATAESSRCLRLVPEARTRLFPRRATLVSADNKFRMPTTIAAGTGVELFLSPFGVGLLSVSVELNTDRLPTTLTSDCVLAFNYRLSQCQSWSVSRIQLDHPEDDPETWAKIEAATRARIAARPTEDAPFVERLIAAGGEYTLPELTDFLLAPLAASYALQVQQSQFSVYTVVRFGEDVQFGDPSSRDDLARLLAGLSQVEEPRHAGAFADSLPIEHALLNRNHWVGVSCLGAAHLVADQSGDVPFNQERVARARDKYFIAYLAAYLQRLTIRRAGDEVGVAVRDAQRPFDSSGEGYRNVLQDACEFAAVDYLPEVSTREAVNRYYRLSQAGMQVAAAWSLVSQSVANLDAGCRAVHAEQHAEGLKHTLNESKELHGKVEWVEVFIVAVYAAELVHIVGDSLGFNHVLIGLSALTCSFLAMYGAHHVLNPGEHVKLGRLNWKVGSAAVLTLVTYLLLGLLIPVHHSHDDAIRSHRNAGRSHSDAGQTPRGADHATGDPPQAIPTSAPKVPMSEPPSAATTEHGKP